MFTCVFSGIVFVRDDEPGKEFRRAFSKRLLTKSTRSSVVRLFGGVKEDDDDVEVDVEVAVEGGDDNKAYTFKLNKMSQLFNFQKYNYICMIM
jgi:hypothetical protein